MLGPPKCGTSSLFAWLCAHPGVQPGVRKELFFLMDEDHPLSGSPNLHTDGLDAYGSLFPDDRGAGPVRIDATTHYLYQKTALEYAQSNESTRVCIVLRDPAERVFSSFNYSKNNLANIDPNLSFREFLDLVAQGRPLYPKFCRSRTTAWVLERDVHISHYARHVPAWLQSLGRERVAVVLFEDLKRDPKGVIANTIAHMGLDPEAAGEIASQTKNVTRPIAFPVLHRLARRLNAAAPFAQPVKKRLAGAYFRLQRKSAPLEDASEAIARLRPQFAEDIAMAEQITGRDLSHWRHGNERSQ
jgi:hypothetical protein